MAVESVNLNIKSKISVLILLMACFVCSQATSKVNSKLSCDSNSIKVFGKVIDVNSIDSEDLDGLVSANLKVKLININSKSLFYDLIYFEQLISSLKARGPPLA